MALIRIVRYWDQNTLIEIEAEDLRAAVIAAVGRGANLGGANLGGADLRGADLGDADLRDANLGDADLGDANLGGADLRGANLRDANLGDADLRDANLGGADLRDADLGDANLGGADLRGANLGGADLRDANLGDANLGGAKNLATAKDLRLPTGETWTEYLTATVPALLTAGGKSLESFGPHFECHTWDNCPMAFAFDGKGLEDVPLLLRPRAQQFIELFDAHQIPWPLPLASAAVDPVGEAPAVDPTPRDS